MTYKFIVTIVDLMTEKRYKELLKINGSDKIIEAVKTNIEKVLIESALNNKTATVRDIEIIPNEEVPLC